MAVLECGGGAVGNRQVFGWISVHLICNDNVCRLNRSMQHMH